MAQDGWVRQRGMIKFGIDLTTTTLARDNYDCLYIGGAGDVSCVAQHEPTTTRLWHSVAAGDILPVPTTNVRLTTSTTASAIKGCTIIRA